PPGSPGCGTRGSVWPLAPQCARRGGSVVEDGEAFGVDESEIATKAIRQYGRALPFLVDFVASQRMTRTERAAYIDQRLAELYPHPAIPLDNTHPDTLLIAVLLSAQCTDKRVNLTTPKLFALAGTPEAMARRSVAEIDAIVRPCGLAPRKAQAIHA